MFQKTYILLAVTATGLATTLELQSVGIGTLLAALGGGLSQMRRLDNKKITLTMWQVVAEIGISAMAGFLTWSLLNGTTGKHFYIWSACLISGWLGSSGLDWLIRKFRVDDA